MSVTKPYQLPASFSGFVVARVKCAACEKPFTTAIRLDNFLGGSGGSFIHDPDDGGCSTYYTVLSSVGDTLTVAVHQNGKVGTTGKVTYRIVAHGEADPLPV